MTTSSEDGGKSSCTSCADIREDACLFSTYIGSTCFSTLVSLVPAKGRRSREFWHHQNPREPVMGIEPMTTVLPRLCATAAPHGPIIYRWAVRDSNPRSRQTADLQSAPFGHFGNCPRKKPTNPPALSD